MSGITEMEGGSGSSTGGGDPGSNDLSKAEIAGISIAAVLGGLLLLFCCLVVLVFLIRHRRKRTGRMPIDIPGEYKYKEPLGGITNAMYAGKFIKSRHPHGTGWLHSCEACDYYNMPP